MILMKLLVGGSVAASLLYGSVSLTGDAPAGVDVASLQASHTAQLETVSYRLAPCSSGCDLWRSLPSR